MSKIHNHEGVQKGDLARWVTRLSLIRRALNDSHELYQEDWGYGGYDAAVMADECMDLSQVSAHELFQPQLLLGLNSKIPSDSHNNKVSEIESLTAPIDGLPEDASERARTIKSFAAQTALKLCGILVESANGLVVPDDAYAGLAYLRADIDEPFDRIMHERLDKKVEPIIRYASFSSSSSEARKFSVYYLIPHYSPSDLGIEADNKYQAWWQELQSDLVKIDAIYPPSENFGTAVESRNPAHEATA